jgi:hypothetical protein
MTQIAESKAFSDFFFYHGEHRGHGEKRRRERIESEALKLSGRRRLKRDYIRTDLPQRRRLSVFFLSVLSVSSVVKK